MLNLIEIADPRDNASSDLNAFKRREIYPNVSKCNAKRCVCCIHLCAKTTITSSVNGRQFSIINNNYMD